MTEAQRPNQTRLDACARAILEKDVGGSVSEGELLEKIDEVLYGPKQVWLAAQEGLMLHREAAEVVAAHLESLIVDKGGPLWAEKDPAISEEIVGRLEAAIFGAG
jgi:hypothetical protein